MTENLLYHHLQNYATSITTPEPPLLAKLRKETQHLPGNQMLSSILQGRTLALLSHILKPKKILEIGTYTGYSTLCLAEGLSPGGTLHTIDKHKPSIDIATKYAQQAGYTQHIHFHIGHALHLIPHLEENFDIIFIDADKKNYPTYYHMLLPKLRPQGIIIADNIFWHGTVLPNTPQKQHTHTKTLANFAKKIQKDPNVEQLCLPIRDGLLIIRKR